MILQLAKRGKTVLLCSHLLADVEDICDRIAILYGGKIQSEGRVKELLRQTDKRQITTGSISDAAVDKIKQVVRDEQADCVVTSPMNKLETFFIETVTAAQQQAQSTGGAVSTTRIGDFLTAPPDEESRRARILDKLVSASVSHQTQAESLKTEQVVPVETSQVPDEQLLSKLTEQTEQVESEPVVGDEQVETEPVQPKAPQPQQEQSKEDILDRLTGRSTPKNKDQKQTDKSQGDSGNG